jgi:protein-tyrosine phosphatase
VEKLIGRLEMQVESERGIKLEGVFNFRDLGGYETTGGRHVKWKRVYRSDNLARLTEADLMTLEALNIRTLVDLRSRVEMEKTPDKIPAGAGYVPLPVQTGELNFVAAMERLQKGDADWLTDDFMLKGYIRNLDEFGHVWADALTVISRPDLQPVVFHCTGGKDRAGTLAALFLLVLGVPEETVIEDHQLSNVFIAPLLGKVNKYVQSLGVDPEKVKPYFTAPRFCIEALLEHLRSRYGTAEQYLIDTAGLNPEVLELLKTGLLD